MKSLSHLQIVTHTAGLDTLFVQIYMDALPGVPGVSKNHIFFTNKTVFVLELSRKGTNFKKSSKLKKRKRNLFS